MYKIYINEKQLILCNSSKLDKYNSNNKKSLVAIYSGKARSLYNYIDLLEKGTDYDQVIIHANPKRQLLDDFKSIYTTIGAGGGIVTNEFDEILFIFRKGYWDLPKGKLDEGETKKQGAIREVMEETGVKDLIIDRKLLKSRHSYKSKNSQRMIKKTHWYLMHTKKQPLTPQAQEDITKAEWMSYEEFFAKPRKVYNSIVDILKAFKKNRTKSILAE